MLPAFRGEPERIVTVSGEGLRGVTPRCIVVCVSNAGHTTTPEIVVNRIRRTLSPVEVAEREAIIESMDAAQFERDRRAGERLSAKIARDIAAANASETPRQRLERDLRNLSAQVGSKARALRAELQARLDAMADAK